MNGHFKDELQDLLSGQLNASEAAAVENHLKSCEECRREYENLRLVKRIIENHLSASEIPSDLQANITKVLDQETRGPKKSWKALLPYAAVLILVLAALFYFLISRSNLPAEVARNFHQFQTGDLSLQLRTNDVQKMEQFYTDQGMPFHVTVFDLRMMKYELVGGSIHKLNQRKTALYVYRGENNKYLICEMYLGTPSELPKNAVVRENKGKRFYIYERNGVTAVFWPEDKVMCVLASDIDPEEIVQLAFAKAKPAE